MPVIKTSRITMHQDPETNQAIFVKNLSPQNKRLDGIRYSFKKNDFSDNIQKTKSQYENSKKQKVENKNGIRYLREKFSDENHEFINFDEAKEYVDEIIKNLDRIIFYVKDIIEQNGIEREEDIIDIVQSFLPFDVLPEDIDISDDAISKMKAASSREITENLSSGLTWLEMYYSIINDNIDNLNDEILNDIGYVFASGYHAGMLDTLSEKIKNIFTNRFRASIEQLLFLKSQLNDDDKESFNKIINNIDLYTILEKNNINKFNENFKNYPENISDFKDLSEKISAFLKE